MPELRSDASVFATPAHDLIQRAVQAHGASAGVRLAVIDENRIRTFPQRSVSGFARKDIDAAIHGDDASLQSTWSG